MQISLVGYYAMVEGLSRWEVFTCLMMQKCLYCMREVVRFYDGGGFDSMTNLCMFNDEKLALLYEWGLQGMWLRGGWLH